MPRKSFPNTGPTFFDLEMYEQQEDTIFQKQTLLRGDFHAPTLAKREEEQGLQDHNQDFGKSLPESLAKYDQSTCLWKTSQLSLAGELEQSLAIFPASFIMLEGELFPHAPLVLHTHASACSLWPTPRTSDAICSRMKVESLAKSYIRGKSSASVAHLLAGEFGLSLHPNMMEWLMGFPPNWSQIEESDFEE